MQNLIIEYLPVTILLVLLFSLAAYLLKYNKSLNLEKRLSKYSLEAINSSSFSLFDKLHEIYIYLRSKLSSALKKSAVLKKHSLKYNKYISYEDEKDICAMDYVSNKFFISFGFVVLCLVANTIVPGMFGFFTTFLIAIFGFFVIDIYFAIYNSFKKKRIEQDLLNAIIIMNNAFRSGRSTMQAIEIVSHELSGPIAQEFKKMYLEINYGLSLDVVFDRFSKRVDSEEVGYITSSLSILNKTGGNIIKVFASIEAMLFNKKKLKEEMKSLTSSSKMLSIFLLILPVALVFVMLFLSYDGNIIEILTSASKLKYFLLNNYFSPLFKNILGWFILFLIVMFYGMYAFIVYRIMKVRFEWWKIDL